MDVKKVAMAETLVATDVQVSFQPLDKNKLNNDKNNEFCLKIANLAIKSLYFEASVAIKPGLEHISNDDTLKGMDDFTSTTNSSVLFETFYYCALEGVAFNSDNYKEMLCRIRPIGIIGGEKILSKTSGGKSYKGIIFIMGIISAALGSLYKARGFEENISIQKVCDRVKEMAEGICDKELAGIKSYERMTYCETLFAKYYVKGIRGEVENGFRTVMDFGLPVMKVHLNEGKNFNDVLVQVLLSLMAKTEDSYVLGRHDMEGLYFVKHCAKKALKLGGAFNEKGRQFIGNLDKVFIKNNISPRGCSNLLVATVMFYLLESGGEVITEK